MDTLLTDPTNAMLQRDYLKTAAMLPYLCGVNFEYPIKPEPWFKSNKPSIAVHEWKEWLGKNSSTILQRIDSKDFEDALKRMYTQSLRNGHTKDLQSIGFSKNMLNVSDFSDKQWDSIVWPETIDRIKCINAIGQLWFGDSIEQNIANNFLLRYSGQNLSEPGLYLKWFRNQKDSVAY
jgi:hypothetical protein